jgi:hypothetical protein
MLKGKWLIAGVLETDALVKVHRVFGSKHEGGYTSVVQILHPATLQVLETVNGPGVPYIAGVDPMMTAYVVLAVKYPKLKNDAPVELPQALIDYFDDETDVHVGDKQSWLQKVKAFFARAF